MTDYTGRKILLLGAAGQVGRELAGTLPELGEVTAITRAQCDLADLDAVSRLLDAEEPDIIVNAAAYTAVDRAEDEPDGAMQLNGLLPQTLARWTAGHGALLVDFSTDYIYDGTGDGPRSESAPPAPLNSYGRSKLAGLNAIRESGCDYLVFIVAWVYALEGKNFPNTMLRLAAERDFLSVVDDQIGAPTPAEWIAEVATQCIARAVADRGKCGLYNMAPAGTTSWHGFAREIIQCALDSGARLKVDPDNIRAVATSEFPAPARRPANSRLDTGRLQDTFGILPASWRDLYRQQRGVCQ